MKLTGKNVFYTVFAAGSLFALTSCDTYSGMTPVPTTEQMSKNEWVYGDPTGPAKHSKNTYPTNPAAIGKASELREMLYGSETSARGTKVAGTMIKTTAATKTDASSAAQTVESATPAATDSTTAQPSVGN